MDTVVMYRPTGPEELELVKASGWRRWPPRLPGQPIFYPVTNEDYAVQIARDWNVPASGYGAVTRFRVSAGFVEKYPVQTVGGRGHTEWWIPAEDLEALNDHIVGLIEVVHEFRADPMDESDSDEIRHHCDARPDLHLPRTSSASDTLG